ncbi:MAG: glycosyltransferase family 2 protein, partial [Candidatus Pacebacteria bacterium]|nr:glycosyltransferase family 2 protein [Candidatus Paceibacterota bacterium]
AKRNNYDIVVNVDGDGQHRADEIKKIMEPVLQKKADVVIGSRLLLKNQKYPILGRRIAQKIISFLILLFSGKRITDSTSGFRCYNKKAIDLLSQYYPTDYPGGEEVVFLIKNGIKIKEVPISIKMRKKGSSFLNITISIHYMIRVALSIFINVFRASIIKEDKN